MEKPVNLLALDGGGIRGVSELLILHEIMRRIQYDLKLPKLPAPCNFFDVIGGTSTGGLIALMLGRLRMTTEEALQAYNSIASAIFSKKNRKAKYKDGAFKATTLETEVKRLVRDKDLGDHMLDLSNDTQRANAFVCAMPAKNMAYPRRFRTYQVRENASPNCFIWEAARATTAAPTFFKRISIGEEGHAKEEFIDGGVRCNNPVIQVTEEARTLFGDDSTLGCLISIGTGHPGVIGLSEPDSFQKILPTEIIGVLKRIATDCESTAEDIAKRFRDHKDHFFRYNVIHGAGSISLEEWKMMADIETHTKAYLEQSEISNSINLVVKILSQARGTSISTIKLRSLSGVLPEVRKATPSLKTRKHKPVSSPLFTGRQDILDRLEEFFKARGAGRHHRREFLLHGLGGAGKSQLMLKFAEIYQDRFEHIFWVDASNKETAEQSYQEIASQLSTGNESKNSLGDAISQLERLNSEWLLLFDGADDIDTISGLFPAGNQGNVIYTSRNPMLRNLPQSQTYEMNTMNKNEAIILLLKAARLDDTYQDQATAIAEELGFLALAIDQAGAYIANGQCTIQDFLEIFRSHRRELMQKDVYKGASLYDRSVYATWDLSYNAMSQSNNTDALWILKIFAFFHNENISIDIFKTSAENFDEDASPEVDISPQDELTRRTHFSRKLLQVYPSGKWDNFAFRQGIGILLSFSLIRQDESRCYFSMHRLVHEWVHDILTAKDQAEYSYVAYSILANSISWRYENRDYIFRRMLLPHVVSCQLRSASTSEPRISAKDKSKISQVFYEAGRWNDVEKLLLQVIKTRKNVLGEDHSSTLISMNDLALTYSDQGRWKKAEELQLQIMKTEKNALEEDHPDTLIGMNNLALTYINQGRWKEAEELLLQIIKTRKNVLEEDHPDTLISMNDLALTYSDQGRWKEAEELQLQVMKTTKKILGEDHPYTLTSMNNLASTYSNQGRWEEAEKLQLQVMKTTKKVLEKDHPSTLNSMNNLALTYRNQGRWEEAEELQLHVMKMGKKIMGKDHSDTLKSIDNLALTYANQGRWKEAEKLQLHVMKTRKKISGEDHPETLRTMHNLALTYHGQGRTDEAIQLMTEVVQCRIKKIGSDHPDTMKSSEALEIWLNETKITSSDEEGINSSDE